MSETILTLTEAAIGHIKTIIKRRGGGIGFHLTIKKTGCSGYMYVPNIIDEVNANDIVIETAKGITVYLDPTCVEIIRGTTLDFVKKDLGMEQLQFNNPNVNGLCGCGESFKLKGDEDG